MRNIRATILAILSLMLVQVQPTFGMPVPQESGPVQVAATPTKPSTWRIATIKMGPTSHYWDKVAQCQSNRNWASKVNFGGGLGITSDLWQKYGGNDFSEHPYQASKAEQIIVANRITVVGHSEKLDVASLNVKPKRRPVRFVAPDGFNVFSCIKKNAELQPGRTVYNVKLPVGEEFYCPQFEKLFKKYALPPKVFSYIAWRESRCNPGAVNAKWKNGKIVWTLNSNGTYDSGLLQVNSSWFRTAKREFGYSSADLFIAEKNTKFASWIFHFSTGRLRNWSVRTY